MRRNDSLKNWIDNEFSDVSLGDKRLDIRLKSVSIGLAEKSENNISSSFDSWKDIKACYRFFSNDKVTPAKLLGPHIKRTIERIQEHSGVLLIQDTDLYSYPNRPGTSNLGLCSKHYTTSTPALSLISHGLLALSDRGLPLGILSQKFIERKTFRANGRLTKQEYQRLPIDTKESFKWIKLIKNCKKFNLKNTQTIHVADREADIYELYRDCADWDEFYIIRASHNRAINKEKRRQPTKEKLFEFLKNSRAQGTVTVNVNSKNLGRKTRKAKLSILYKTITIAPPPNRTKNNSYENLPSLQMTAIMAVERNPPKDETALNWTLLTNLPIDNIEDAQDKIKLYSLRWNIELFHKKNLVFK